MNLYGLFSTKAAMAEATQRAVVAGLDWAGLFKSWRLFTIKAEELTLCTVCVCEHA